MVIAAVLGGGRGARMGTEMPKQFLPLGGRPVFLHSLSAFTESGLADAALLLVPEEYVPFAEETVQKAGLSAPVRVLPGGDTRSASLLKSLEAARSLWGLKNNIIQFN